MAYANDATVFVLPMISYIIYLNIALIWFITTFTQKYFDLFYRI